MKTSEVRDQFMRLRPADQESVLALSISEEAVTKAGGDPAKMFNAISEDFDDLARLAHLLESNPWVLLPAVAETSAKPSDAPKPSKNDEGGVDLNQVYKTSIRDGSMRPSP